MRQLLLLGAIAGSAASHAGPWGQCGGQEWTGSTACQSGRTCMYMNQWYSRCLQSSTAAGSGPTETLTPTTKLTSTASSTTASNAWIVPGAVWYDTDGNKIDAHGGGIVQRGNTFYWSGHSASGQTPMMYSSTDLLNWKNLGPQASSVIGMWRPKIAKPNGQFWLYGQQDRYVLSLVSSQIVGGYKQSAKVHLPPAGYSYSDTGMFQDPSTSTWYILTSADHNTIQINQINSDGTVGNRVQAFTKGAFEAPGLFKAGGVYFLIVSAKTGWRANPNKVFWATSLSGPWNGGTNIAPEAENTYGSQNTFELTVSGSKQTTYIFMGDAWDSNGGARSNYVWLPMAVDTSGKTVTLQYHPMWKVDVNTGEVSFPTTNRRYEAEHAIISGRAVVSLCSSCKSKRAVDEVRTNDEVTFYNVTGSGRRQWLTFHYTVSNPDVGEAHIFVNDNPVPINISDLNSRAGYNSAIPIQLVLDPGDVNSIRFGAYGTKDFKATIDAIDLYDD